MKLQRQNIEGVIVLRVTGEIDFSSTHALLSELRNVGAEGRRNILVDLSRCSGLASTAVGILVGWRCEASLHGREFWLVSPSEEVREILNMVGVYDQLVRPEETEEAAIEALRTELTT